MQRDAAAVGKLKAYLRDSALSKDEMEEHFKELTSKNDRLVAILGAAAVEGALQGVLKEKMPRLSKTLERSVFDFQGPLGTLSAKADVAAALGLISPACHRNVDYIREIRNAFSHTLKPIRFQKDPIKSVCALLEYSDQVPKYFRHLDRKGYRRRFFIAVIDTGRAIWGHHKL